MFTAFTTMFKQFFSMITIFFSAGEKVAKTVDNLAGWGEAASESIANVASIERQVNRFEAVNAAKARAKLLGLTLNNDLEIIPSPAEVKATKAIAA